jgi:hypothetical protein
MPDDLAYDLDSLAVDVFGLTEAAGAVESLTGHGMTELATSCPCTCTGLPIEWFCSGSCSANAVQ